MKRHRVEKNTTANTWQEEMLAARQCWYIAGEQCPLCKASTPRVTGTMLVPPQPIIRTARKRGGGIEPPEAVQAAEMEGWDSPP